MSKCVAASSLAGVVACAVFTAMSSAWAQDVSPAPVPPEPEEFKVEDQTEPSGDGSMPLPGITVDSPPVTTSSSSGQSDNAAGGGGGQSTGTGEAAAEEVTEGVILGGAAVSDTGTTVFDARNIQMRTDGSGDANSFLRNLPNVQYQNDIDDDPGVNLYEIIDTRPLEVSISGARKYENNFILNGVSINSIAGLEPFDVEDIHRDTREVPNLNGFYGAHSQTVFVPSEFLGSATVIDSNASAEYGEFQGGVVLYDLAKPPTDRYHATATYSRHNDDMVNYILATENGKNPLGRLTPTFTRENLSASVGAPITNDLSFILQASRKTAETTRQKEYELFDETVDDDSQNMFFRFATSLKTEIGSFTIDSSLTDYSQLWHSPGWRDLEMDVQTKSSTTQIEYLGALQDVTAPQIGLSNVTLKTRAYYNDSETGNYTNGDVGYAHPIRKAKKVGGVWTETYSTDDYSDWCRAVPDSATSSTATSNNTICYEGGYGNKEMEQIDTGLQAQLRGKVLLGSFLLGGEAKSVEGRRRRIGDYTYYSSYGTASGDASAYTPPSGSYDCDPNDDTCTDSQFAKVKIVSPAYDIEQTVNALHGYGELDQTLGWFNVRAGLRVDYEDYFKNTNLAPRLAATITPFPGLSFTGGYNRYYIGETLYYALRDSQPFSETYIRRLKSGTDTPDEWKATSTGRFYTFASSNLETPFNDEYTGAVRIKDPFVGGNLRLRYLERYGRDQFASVDCGRNCLEMTNDGHTFYRSASAEYEKFWRTPMTPFLSAMGIAVGATWEERSISRAAYFDTDENDVYYLYKGKSYTPQSFTAVTGNLDIPIRIGGTLSTNWFNDMLTVDLSAGYNLGYDGVYDTGEEVEFNGRPHQVYADRKFGAALQFDLAAELAVTEQAYISARVNNVLNTAGNAITTNANPWIVGRSVWVESGLRF